MLPTAEAISLTRCWSRGHRVRGGADMRREVTASPLNFPSGFASNL
jgi:hypothetical protein